MGRPGARRVAAHPAAGAHRVVSVRTGAFLFTGRPG